VSNNHPVRLFAPDSAQRHAIGETRPINNLNNAVQRKYVQIYSPTGAIRSVAVSATELVPSLVLRYARIV
jgi:hypothetical protein